jgi:hypothetical protein
MSDNPNEGAVVTQGDPQGPADTGNQAKAAEPEVQAVDASNPTPPTAADILRVKLSDARAKVAQARKSNMLDQLADGVCEAIDAFLETLPN